MGDHRAGYAPLPRCAHGTSRCERCPECDAEREAFDLAERRRINDPAQVILDALTRHRRWFDTCALCGDALDNRMRHAANCPWLLTMEEAQIRYQLHRVEREGGVFFAAAQRTSQDGGCK